ncbi:class I SAM-dependent methyltransferase [Lacticaseibacillus saniviri]|nr:methyltransferase domain-containing protein [Lacticaseibacillus saniviri]
METPHDWDEFASLYNAIQNESTLSIEEDVIAELRRQHLLPAITVMDLASGSGRFALPLAQYSDKVILLDWSKEMLRLAQQAAANAQITN